MATVDPVDELLTPAEVAEMFGVNSKTVTRWADSGRLGFHSHPGWTPQIPSIGDHRPARRQQPRPLTNRGGAVPSGICGTTDPPERAPTQ